MTRRKESCAPIALSQAHFPVSHRSLIALLPHRLVEAIVGALFLIGAVMLWFRGTEEEQHDVAVGARVNAQAGFLWVASASFAVIFLAEFGDLTQILTANLAARYHAPWSVHISWYSNNVRPPCARLAEFDEDMQPSPC